MKYGPTDGVIFCSGHWMGLGFDDPLHRKLPTGWLEKPWELGKGPVVLSYYGGPRECGVLQHDCSVTGRF